MSLSVHSTRIQPIHQVKNIYTFPPKKELFELIFFKRFMNMKLCSIIAKSFCEKKFENVEKIEEALRGTLPKDVSDEEFNVFFNILVYNVLKPDLRA